MLGLVVLSLANQAKKDFEVCFEQTSQNPECANDPCICTVANMRCLQAKGHDETDVEHCKAGGTVVLNIMK